VREHHEDQREGAGQRSVERAHGVRGRAGQQRACLLSPEPARQQPSRRDPLQPESCHRGRMPGHGAQRRQDIGQGSWSFTNERPKKAAVDRAVAV
jgi:hypothetical protein